MLAILALDEEQGHVVVDALTDVVDDLAQEIVERAQILRAQRVRALLEREKVAVPVAALHQAVGVKEQPGTLGQLAGGGRGLRVEAQRRLGRPGVHQVAGTVLGDEQRRVVTAVEQGHAPDPR